ncbi:MAG: hypothetical protein V9G22_09860 [Ottowia sp.]
MRATPADQPRASAGRREAARERDLEAARLHGREREREAVAVEHVLHDREAQPAAARAPRAAGDAAVRALGHARELVGRDARAVVEHAEAEPRRRRPRGLEDHRDVRVGVRDRVVDDVADGLLEQRHVAEDLHGRLRHGVLERDAAAARDRRVPVHGPPQHLPEVHAVPVEVDLAGLEPRDRAQVVEQHPDVVRLLERALHALAVGRPALGGLVAQRGEVGLQHGERRADVVGRVADEVAQRALAGLDGREVRADRAAARGRTRARPTSPRRRPRRRPRRCRSPARADRRAARAAAAGGRRSPPRATPRRARRARA